ncbi:MAG: PIN domain-containing protein [Anaerolineae bacterium]|nr:PIN domain-containing protein [Anaerolineae bacterium]
MRNFLTGLVNSDIEFVPIESADLVRIDELLGQYADANLDFADVALIAIAERLDISHILTFDHRDYSIIRPRHAEAFQLLP